MKNDFKQAAIDLRSSGLSYSEILKEIHVSKSTLSLWIRSISLTESQKERLKLKKVHNIANAQYKNRQRRIERTNLIKVKAKQEIQKVTKFDLLLMGVMLYWAEGVKQKDHDASQGICFSNSDPYMLRLFLSG